MTAHARVTCSEFGVTPFSLPLGVLRVRDEVDVNIDLNLPAA